MPSPDRQDAPFIRGPNEPTRMILLTFSLVGLQLTWGLEQTYCTPYLLSLGLTKSGTSAVWIAGPLSGLFMQPIVGALADTSTSRFGRRRPFMIGGSIVMTFSLLLLGWTREVTEFLLGSDETAFKKSATIVLAVFSIYALDFAINAVQACCRSIIVDVLPIEQQQMGNAWAARTAACGHVTGFMIGTLDLVAVLPGWVGGDTQFKKMCWVAIVGLWAAVGVTSWAVREKPLVRSTGDGDALNSLSKTMKDLWTRTWNLPPRIQQICRCQFWGWIGWFPFFFYCSTWVGEVYYKYEHPPAEPGSADNHDALGNVGRLGSIALVMFSSITFASSVLLPSVVRKPAAEEPGKTTSRGRFTPRLPRGMGTTLQQVLLWLYEIPKPDLVTTWGLGQIMFASVMIWAPFVHSFRFATILVGLCGIPNAVASWAPFAEMGMEINRMAHGGAIPMSGNDYKALDADDDDLELQDRATTGGSILQPVVSNDGTSGELAGIYLGVLNVYTTLPQFVGTFISWVVFSLLDPGSNAPEQEKTSQPEHHKYLDLKGTNAIAVCLFIGAICAMVGARATFQLKKMN